MGRGLSEGSTVEFVVEGRLVPRDVVEPEVEGLGGEGSWLRGGETRVSEGLEVEGWLGLEEFWVGSLLGWRRKS